MTQFYSAKSRKNKVTSIDDSNFSGLILTLLTPSIKESEGQTDYTIIFDRHKNHNGWISSQLRMIEEKYGLTRYKMPDFGKTIISTSYYTGEKEAIIFRWRKPKIST